MAEHPEVKRRSLKQIVRGGLYNAVFQPGLSRWLLLAVAAFIFMLSALYLTSSVDFREDPSALVPRSADAYVETRNLGTLLKNVAAWKIWRPEHRATGQEVHSTDLEKEVAAVISRQVPGLPITTPLRWMTESTGAALCVSAEGEASSVASWALYLRLDDAASALNDIEIEPGMKLELGKGTRDNGVFLLTGPGGGRLSIGVIAPWLILSADDKLADFALEAKRRPSQSLAGTKIVPRWKRGAAVRGVVNPSYRPIVGETLGGPFVSNWFASDARMVFTAKSGRSGEVETAFSVVALNDRVGGGGFWPFFFIIGLVLAILSLAVILAVLLAMLGWGGWLKIAAAKAGIVPAAKPEQVVPSAAFQHDSGMRHAGGNDAPEEREAPVTAEIVEQDILATTIPDSPVMDESEKFEFGIKTESEKQDDAVEENTESDTNESKNE